LRIADCGMLNGEFTPHPKPLPQGERENGMEWLASRSFSGRLRFPEASSAK